MNCIFYGRGPGGSRCLVQGRCGRPLWCRQVGKLYRTSDSVLLLLSWRVRWPCIFHRKESSSWRCAPVWGGGRGGTPHSMNRPLLSCYISGRVWRRAWSGFHCPDLLIHMCMTSMNACRFSSSRAVRSLLLNACSAASNRMRISSPVLLLRANCRSTYM